MNSAPVDRTNSSSLVRAEPGDVPARGGGERDGVPADGSARAGDQEPAVGRLAQQRERLEGGDGVERNGRGVDQVEALGHRRDGVGVEQHVLGQGAVRPGGDVVETRDQVAGGVRRDVRADLDHAARHVPAETDGTAGREDAAARLGGDEDVDGVDRGGRGLDEDLAGAGVGTVALDDLGLVVAGDGLDGSHRSAPLVWGSGCHSTMRRLLSFRK